MGAAALARSDVRAAGIIGAKRWARRGLPQSENPKQLVTLRLDADVLRMLRDSGPGWQTRVNAILRASLETTSSRDEVSNRRQTEAEPLPAGHLARGRWRRPTGKSRGAATRPLDLEPKYAKLPPELASRLKRVVEAKARKPR
jgi:uncharacterized protein (DUF4415 family)